MSIQVGRVVKKRREWARLTQQELVDHTRLDRSASYISAIENGKTSPTIDELDRLARYFRLTLFELLQEAAGSAGSPAGGADASAQAKDDPIARAASPLNEQEKELVLGFIELLRKHRR